MKIIPAETIGTALLILFGGGVNAAVSLTRSKAQGSGWVVIAFGWGFGVMIGAYAVGQFSGAHLNPAVTLGLWIDGNIKGGVVYKYLIGEFCGAFIGATLVFLAYYQHFQQTEDQDAKLGVFCTSPAIPNKFWNLMTEVIGTFALVLGILAIAGNKAIGLTDRGSGLGTLIVALLIVAIGMSLGGPTGYAINPARDLGPRIMHALLPIPGKGSSQWSYAWVPVVGPLIGGALGGLVYWATFPH